MTHLLTSIFFFPTLLLRVFALNFGCLWQVKRWKNMDCLMSGLANTWRNLPICGTVAFVQGKVSRLGRVSVSGAVRHPLRRSGGSMTARLSGRMESSDKCRDTLDTILRHSRHISKTASVNSKVLLMLQS